jgi:threonyl-tRNA synthetase
MLVVGDREQEAGEVGVREHRQGDVGSVSVTEFTERLTGLIESRALGS